MKGFCFPIISFAQHTVESSRQGKMNIIF